MSNRKHPCQSQGALSLTLAAYGQVIAGALVGGADGASSAAAATAVPEPLTAAFALLITATAAGLAKGTEIGIDEAQYDIIEDAMDSADRCVAMFASSQQLQFVRSIGDGCGCQAWTQDNSRKAMLWY